MQRWGHLLSMRWGEGICGRRRQVMKGQCLQLYEILQELGEDVGVMIGSDGKKRLAPHQLANLDDTCMRMLSKMSPVIAMKGAPKALRAEHKNYRESQTLLLTIFADGVARVPPFLIVNGSEGDEGHFLAASLLGHARLCGHAEGHHDGALAYCPAEERLHDEPDVRNLDSGLLHTGARCTACVLICWAH